MWVVVDGQVVNAQPVEEAVIKAVEASQFSPSVTMPELKWDALSGSYYFTRAGMLIGVEADGYMHS